MDIYLGRSLHCKDENKRKILHLVNMLFPILPPLEKDFKGVYPSFNLHITGRVPLIILTGWLLG